MGTCKALPVDRVTAAWGTDRDAQLLQPRGCLVSLWAAIAAPVAGGAPQANALLLRIIVLVAL